MQRNNSFDIDALSDLAKLTFSNDEKKVLEAEMRSFFELADKLSAVDTENIEITDHIENMTNVFRADTVRSDFTADEMLGGVKTKAEGYITVPIVVEG